jgi:hypothetical protein
MKLTEIKDLDAYLETHFEIVQAITIEWLKDEPKGKVKEKQEESGHGGLYELAKDLTDKFETLHENTEWGMELGYLETLENFLDEELK